MTKLTLTAAQKSNAGKLSINRGSVLKVRVDDAGQFLGKKTKDGRDPSLIMGVWGPNGFFHPMYAASQDEPAPTSS